MAVLPIVIEQDNTGGDCLLIEQGFACIVIEKDMIDGFIEELKEAKEKK